MQTDLAAGSILSRRRPLMLARFRPYGPLLLVLSAGGCFDYGNVPRASLVAGREIRIAITPDARTTLANQIGTQVRTVTGRLRTVDTSVVTLSMMRTTLIDGTEAPWNGEIVTIPVSDIAVTEQRKISSGKTIGLVVIITAVTAAIALSVGLSTSSSTSTQSSGAK
jgi:hypothetical protein